MNIDEFVRNFGVLSGIITIIAIIVSLATIGVSSYIGRKTLYAKTVSENRVKWLYKLRKMIYKFIKLSRSNDSCDEKLIDVKNQIQLHYNIDEQADLITLIDKIIVDKMDEGLKGELIEYCQIAFKSEWDKVKKEAGESILSRNLKKINNIRKGNLYKKLWIKLHCKSNLLIVIIKMHFKLFKTRLNTGERNMSKKSYIIVSIIFSLPLIFTLILLRIFFGDFNSVFSFITELKKNVVVEAVDLPTTSEIIYYLICTYTMLLSGLFSYLLYKVTKRNNSIAKDNNDLGVQTLKLTQLATNMEINREQKYFKENALVVYYDLLIGINDFKKIYLSQYIIDDKYCIAPKRLYFSGEWIKNVAIISNDLDEQERYDIYELYGDFLTIQDLLIKFENKENTSDFYEHRNHLKDKLFVGEIKYYPSGATMSKEGWTKLFYSPLDIENNLNEKYKDIIKKLELIIDKYSNSKSNFDLK
ncbi:hypothetical protein LL037_10515 [Clostridium estertheticum]|uniref:hypothetical protein n=1 Tax=Clostridium estertheticum TaxID=238834 RepID=UPI001C0BE11C|nr:hypothetical protein [Clostridium estertheticum]MBU3199812.1 hypothetical protein [Clostridium estertheticum]WAG67535.1 hypothetical protein LL037_10515 [Clostridium estertheticum]